MELVQNPSHIFSCIVIFISGFILLNRTKNYFNTKTHRILLIYVWHTSLCVFYAWYATNNVSDAVGYYRSALSGQADFSLGTAAVKYISIFFVYTFNLSFLGACLVFNIIGTLGLIAFDSSLIDITKNSSKKLKLFSSIIIFLPSISFWSSAIGKDAISFMAIGLALWASLNLNKRIIIMFFAIFSMLMVRPHMAGLMLIGLTFAYIFDKKTSFSKKIILGTISFIITAALIPFALNYAGVGETVNTDTLIEYVENRQSHNMEGGGGIDIASMSLPMKLFTYLFRPTIIEARNIFSLAAAIDNTILLYLFIASGFNILRKRKIYSNESRIFMWTYSLTAWLILSMTTANMGIALRQKWMFTPLLIFLLISVIGKTRNNLFQSPNIQSIQKTKYTSTHL